MDIYMELGALALSGRLRRLSERMAGDVTRIYKMQNLEFEARWFVMYRQLLRGGMAVTELGEALGFTHAAVHLIAREMERAGLLTSNKDRADARRRVLRLTPKGIAMEARLKPLWDDIEKANQLLLQESETNILDVFTQIEKALDQNDMFSRIQLLLRTRSEKEINIQMFESRWAEDFKRLNYVWLKKYFTIEPLDKKILSQPEKIIEGGGQIFVAVHHGEAIGVCGLINHGEGTMELAKMAVDDRFQGHGIGLLLARSVLAEARRLGADNVFLETSVRLKAALALYRKLGFKKVSAGAKSKYKRTTIRLELPLQ